MLMLLKTLFSLVNLALSRIMTVKIKKLRDLGSKHLKCPLDGNDPVKHIKGEIPTASPRPSAKDVIPDSLFHLG